MTWRLVHHFVGSPCRRGAHAMLSRISCQPRAAGACPVDIGLGAGSRLSKAVTAVLHRRGIDYAPSEGGNSWLWCLGGPSLYRHPPHDGDLATDADMCVDLQLSVCDLHEAISVELYPYDLVPESGGSGPADPRRSEPVELGAAQDLEAAVLGRLEPWLDEILILPR